MCPVEFTYFSSQWSFSNDLHVMWVVTKLETETAFIPNFVLHKRKKTGINKYFFFTNFTFKG